MKARLFFEGAGAAILLLVVSFWDFLSPYHLILYHNPCPLSTVAAGFAIDLVAASILGALLFYFLDRYDLRKTSLIWAAIIIWLILRITSLVIFFLSYYDTEILSGHKPRTVIRIATYVGVLLLWWRARASFQKCVQGARVVFALLGCSILWMLPQLILFAARTPPRTVSAFTKTDSQRTSTSQDRIVWILLDELSYDQVFDHRQPGINLPRLDQLKNESVSFANVQPAGYYTDIVIPSLLLGRTLNGIRSGFDGSLYMHEAGTPGWHPFDSNATLFKNAQDQGWNTGVAGWFNPYCRILENVLDSCYWQYITFFQMHMSDQKSSFANALAFASRTKDNVNSEHAEEYKDLLDPSITLLKNESIRFAFIHLPVPHPPGIYDRRTNTFSRRGTYLDNLVLTDQALGTLLDTLGKTASASHTTLIVSSDHSWRVGMWRSAEGWSREEEQASNGKFDPRPVLLIHFPQEASAETRSAQFPEIRMHELLQSMLKSEIHSQSDLDTWLANQ